MLHIFAKPIHHLQKRNKYKTCCYTSLILFTPGSGCFSLDVHGDICPRGGTEHVIHSALYYVRRAILYVQSHYLIRGPLGKPPFLGPLGKPAAGRRPELPPPLFEE